MPEKTDLQRFIAAHQNNYTAALSEIKKGRKQTHWMWYIFPQLKELGLSETAKNYGIIDIDEAAAFLQDTLLGSNLIEISTVLVSLDSKNAHAIFGSPDDMKLHSSMTLFAAVPTANPVFQQVLDKFFDGVKDKRKLDLLGGKD